MNYASLVIELHAEPHYFIQILVKSYVKLSCDSRFQRVFTACICVFKVITLVGSNQHNYFENASASSKRTLKMTFATQLQKPHLLIHYRKLNSRTFNFIGFSRDDSLNTMKWKNFTCA